MDNDIFIEINIKNIEVGDNVRKIQGYNGSDIKNDSLENFPLQFQSDIKTLSYSLKDHGLLNPITVRKVGDNSYHLIAGFRRLKAAQYLGWEKIDAKVCDFGDNELVVQLVENIHRENLCAMDVAGALKDIMRIKGFKTQNELGQYVGKTQPWVSQHMSLLDADEGIKEAVSGGEVCFSAALNFMKLSPEEQKVALMAARRHAEKRGENKISNRNAKGQVEKIKNKEDGKQEIIRPVKEREQEQKKKIIDDFLFEYCVDNKMSDNDIEEYVIDKFWDFLFKRNRIYIRR